MASGRLDDTDEGFAELTDGELVEIRQGALDELERLLPSPDELLAALPDEQLDGFIGSLKDMGGEYVWRFLFDIHGQSSASTESVELETWKDLRRKHEAYQVQDQLRLRVESEMNDRMRERLRLSRLALGISLKDVARLAGTHSKSIERLEQGQTEASAAWFFERACTDRASTAAKLPLNLRVWLPLVDPRLCRTIRNVTVNPAWLASSEGAVLVLARAIRQGRTFDRLPELGEMLRSSGCDNQDIVEHCQNPGLHAVGCWVVDALVRAGRSV